MSFSGLDKGIFTQPPNFGDTALFLLLFFLLLWLWCRQLERVRRSVDTRSNLFPGAGTPFKIAKRLCELEWLGDNPLLLFVVPDLGVSRKGEVLAQRVSFKTVVGHDAAQVGVAEEEDSEQIVGLALVPVCAVVEARDAGYWRRLVGIGLDTNARVVADAK